ncbi:MAG: glutamate-5-semialdehyde dehydrogenase [Chloroflexota bacterium]
MNTKFEELHAKAHRAKETTRRLAVLPSSTKNRALRAVARSLRENQAVVLNANEEDYAEARVSGMNEAMLDRLLLTPARIEAMATDVVSIAGLPDPVGQVFDSRTLANGLQVEKRRVPLGVIAAIYESRPNVTVDISSLCLKAGNATLLRGGKEARRSNKALATIVQDACRAEGVPDGSVQFIESTDRTLVNEMLKMNRYIDLIIPRGRADLIRLVAENATMAVVTGGIGVCHTYVDRTADIEKAVKIVDNAKVQRPTVCNALDCVLVHREIAGEFLPRLAKAWRTSGVEMRCDETALEVLRTADMSGGVPAGEMDWGMEYLALIASIRVVDSLDAALEHIAKYGSGHSESIVTDRYSAARRFLNEVDAACVYVNASTRFTDGAQFGLGAEIGISTQKFHARGPMGLEEITSYKWVIHGSGQIRE